MKHVPPKCSSEWTPEERQRLAAFIIRMTLDKIRADDPAMPVLSKVHVYELLRSVEFLLTRPKENLEAERAGFEKPFDSDKDYHAVVIVNPKFLYPSQAPEK